MKKLNQVVALGLVRGDRRVIAAGPLVKLPGNRPYRIVLCHEGNQFIVWNECFPEVSKDARPEYELHLECADAESFMHNGSYFRTSDLGDAMKRFAERIERQADYAESIYRERIEGVCEPDYVRVMGEAVAKNENFNCELTDNE